jgi:phosphoglycerate dehydrogenase-like enzyme
VTKFRVAIDGDFIKPDGSPAYPDFDLAPLHANPNVEVRHVALGKVSAASALEGFDALILLANRFAAESVPADGRLRIVARFGVGYDSVDVDACTKAGIAVTITPDGVRRPVAVAILTLLFALTGRLFAKDRLTRQGPAGYARRNDFMGVGLMGRTLASVGIGNIGAELFRLAAPLGMKFIAHDPFANKEAARALGITLVDLETVFREGDFVNISCPLTPETHHLVNAERLALMKPTAFLINTARGPIVDQKAITKALQEGRIAGAGLDVQEQEPPDLDDPLLTLDNVILAPHALCWTDQCFAGIGASAVRSVLDIAAGHLPRGLLNRSIAQNARWNGFSSVAEG